VSEPEGFRFWPGLLQREIEPESDIVLGNTSGIRNSLFDVAEVGDGETRHLRACPFFLELPVEVLALRVSCVLKAVSRFDSTVRLRQVPITMNRAYLFP
jgi:hypothetical protein